MTEERLTREIAQRFLDHPDSVDIDAFTQIDEDAVELFKLHNWPLPPQFVESITDREKATPSLISTDDEDPLELVSLPEDSPGADVDDSGPITFEISSDPVNLDETGGLSSDLTVDEAPFAEVSGDVADAVDEDSSGVYSIKTEDVHNIEVTGEDGSAMAKVSFTGSSFDLDEPPSEAKTLGEKIQQRDEQKVAAAERLQKSLREWQQGVDEHRATHADRDRRARRAFMFAPAIPLFLAGGLLLLLWIPATMLSKIAKETDLSPVADGLFSWGIFIIMSSLFVSVAAYALMHFSEQAERKTPGFVNDSNLLFRPFLDWRSWFRRGPNWIDRIIERISAMLRRDKSGRDGPVTVVPVAFTSEPASSDESEDL